MNQSFRLWTLLPPLLLFVGVFGFLAMVDHFKETESETHTVVSYEVGDEIAHLHFEDLGKASLDPRTTEPVYPPDLESLDGKWVSIAGLMDSVQDLENPGRCVLLPIANEAYPNPKKVVLVEVQSEFLSRNTGLGQIASSPVIVTGVMHLARRDSTMWGHELGFFYCLDEAIIEQSPMAGMSLRGGENGPRR